MKTNTIQIITTAVATGLVAGFGSTTVTGNFFTGVVVAVSSWAMVALIAIIASDYRSGPKAYFAAKLATGHFQRATSASATLRTPGTKAA